MQPKPMAQILEIGGAVLPRRCFYVLDTNCVKLQAEKRCDFEHLPISATHSQIVEFCKVWSEPCRKGADCPFDVCRRQHPEARKRRLFQDKGKFCICPPKLQALCPLPHKPVSLRDAGGASRKYELT